MPRLRVDPATPDSEIADAVRNLFDASHVIDQKLTHHCIPWRDRDNLRTARDGIHDEIERLTGILARRRARVPA